MKSHYTSSNRRYIHHNWCLKEYIHMYIKLRSRNWNISVCTGGYKSQASLVDIVPRLQPGQPRNHTSVPISGKRFLWVPPSILFSGYNGLLLWVKGWNIQLTTKHLSSTEVEMSGPKCSLPYVFMACTGTIYILPQPHKIYVIAMNRTCIFIWQQ